MDVKPRKSPHQRRAKATVDAIVEASAQLLLEGYDRFTTARAAERAGVSVGSLYQYFPNKAALAAAVIDRSCAAFLATFEAALAARPRASLAQCVDAIVEVGLVSHHLAPELHRVVLDLAPRLGVADRAERVSALVAKAIESVLGEHRGEIAPDLDLAAAATIVETVLEALAHRLMLADPAPVPDARLAAEARRLILNYLARR
jgi:AcrR family transcriptional regulator